MRLPLILGVGLALAVLAPLAAEEGGAPDLGIKTEAPTAMAEGTKGHSVGVIISHEKGKLILQTAEGNLLFMPHWRGGMPKDGGGPDKAVMERLAGFKPGDKVRIEWTWQERRRIESIAPVAK